MPKSIAALLALAFQSTCLYAQLSFSDLNNILDSLDFGFRQMSHRPKAVVESLETRGVTAAAVN